MSLTLQSSFGVAHAIRKIRGSRDTSSGDPLSLAIHGWKQCGSPRRKSETPVIDLRRRNACRRRIIPSLELAVIRREARSTSPYLHGKPLPGRRHPVKAASREAGARNAPALTGWRWSGLLGPSRQGSLLLSQPQPALSAEAPFNVAPTSHQAGDVLPDPLVEHGLPRNEAEAEASIAA
jgi:hypothetical protein